MSARFNPASSMASRGSVEREPAGIDIKTATNRGPTDT